MSIKDLPKHQRPREKLLSQGAESSSDAELIAILFRTGTKGKTAIELAQKIIDDAGGSFQGLAGRNINDLTKIPGIKEAKVITLAAALEISRRISKQILRNKGVI